MGWKWNDLLRKGCSFPSSGCLGLAKEGFVKGFESRKRKREGR